MRKLQNSKCFGEVYSESLPPGSLTIFCPSCPQPGINLATDWMNIPNWLTCRTITVDGNFHADHIKMRRPDLNIMLTNGNGYMVEDAHFREYLSNAKEPRFVGIFKYLWFSLFLTYPTEAILSQSPSCQCCKLDATRVIACCCTRHGCFIPTSVCDMQKGER